jgi:Holliday junction DNA helicase RuvB
VQILFNDENQLDVDYIVIDEASMIDTHLTGLERADILFIDEIHCLPRVVEEYLYSAMEDFRIDVMIDQGPNARNASLSIPQSTFVGAITRMDLLSAPLRSRFILQSRFDYYSVKDLCQIVKINVLLLDISITDDCALKIANRSRGTPRIVNNLL